MYGPLQIYEACKIWKHWYYKARGLIIKPESQKLYTQISSESFKKVLYSI